MKHFNAMPANAVAIGTVEALLEAFFNVQANEHVKAWRWQCYVAGNYHEEPMYSGKLIYGSRERV